jgi:hypothetical protein
MEMRRVIFGSVREQQLGRKPSGCPPSARGNCVFILLVSTSAVGESFSEVEVFWEDVCFPSIP